MSRSLSISKAGLPAKLPGKTIRKAAKKAADHHHPKKHVGPGDEHREKHDAQAESRRAYLHLARASSLLDVLQGNKAFGDLEELYSFCRKMFETGSVPPKTVAESARALEHLCFACFAIIHSPSITTHDLTKAQKQEFERHFEHDFQKQEEHLQKADAAFSRGSDKRLLSQNALLDLARHSLSVAKQMLQQENWHLAHEFLRATDAITKGLQHLV